MAEDPRIAAFARENRRRRAIILLILGLLATVGSAITLYIVWTRDNDLGDSDGAGYELLAYCAGGIVIGLVLLTRALLLVRKRA